jgi:hypothetical protein
VFAAVAASGAMIGGGHAFDRFSLVPVVMHNPKSTFDVGFAEVKFPADAAQEFNTWYEALRGVVRRGRSADRCRVTPRDDV